MCVIRSQEDGQCIRTDSKACLTGGVRKDLSWLFTHKGVHLEKQGKLSAVKLIFLLASLSFETFGLSRNMIRQSSQNAKCMSSSKHVTLIL